MGRNSTKAAWAAGFGCLCYVTGYQVADGAKSALLYREGSR